MTQGPFDGEAALTVSTQQNENIFLGNNSSTSFSYNFIMGTATNAVVAYTDTSGNQTTLSPTQYTLTINAPATNQIWGSGGTVTYSLAGPSPIPNGSSLTVSRLVPLTQGTSISNEGNFYPQTVETALDTLCFEIQQVSSRTGQFRGTWATDILYNFGDYVIDGANGGNTLNYYMCVLTNTSGTWSTDLANGDWTLVINVQSINASVAAASASAAAALVSQNAAAASATSASSSATTATTEAGIATTQAGIATAAATNAATSASAASNYAQGYSGTSTTNLAIGTGSQTFTTQSGKLWVNGQYLVTSSSANTANYMHGAVTSYSGTTLIINVTDVGGTGSHADWNISISGTQGPVGPAGGGTVTSVSVLSANGLAGTVANSTTTPAITLSTSVNGLLKGNGTAISAATAGTDYQAAGNYITALTGDIIASGPGSVGATLATVNSNVGSFNNANLTVNAKGLITAVSGGTISPISSYVNFNWTGSTISINLSNNISSVTRTSTGSYTISFTTAMSDANYLIHPSLLQANGADYGFTVGVPSTSSFSVTFVSTSTAEDPGRAYVTTIGG